MGNASQFNPNVTFNAAGTGLVGPNGDILLPISKQAMLTVACGNSLPGISKRNIATSYFNYASVIHHANDLSGAPMRFKRIPAYQTTRMDQYGIYSYSGANLGPTTVGGSRANTILNDIQAQWLTPLASAGLVPDLVLGYGLLENDIGNNATYAACVSSLTEWILTVQATWPNVKIILFTPLPNTAYAQATQAARYAIYTQVRDYILTLDNGINILVARGDVLEDPSNLGVAASITVTATITGTTTMTVTSVDTPAATAAAFPLMNIGRNASILFTGVSGTPYITAQGSGVGGVGSYTLSSAQTNGTYSIRIYPYVDGVIHPSARGALEFARRSIEPVFAKLGSKWVHPFTGVAANMALNGSVATDGTNTTGTKPTGVYVGGSASNTQVVTALQPGFNVKTTFGVGSGAATTSGVFYLGWIGAAASVAVAPITSDVSAFCSTVINNGGNNFGGTRLQFQVADGGTNPTYDAYMSQQTTDTDPDYQNGDVLTQISPPLANPAAGTGFIQNANPTYSAYGKLYGGLADYTFLTAGWLQTTPAKVIDVPCSATTSAYTVPNFIDKLTLSLVPAGITTLTITSPTNPVDGQILTITNTGSVSNLVTLTMPAGFKGGAATLAQYATETFQYNATDSLWYRTA